MGFERSGPSWPLRAVAAVGEAAAAAAAATPAPALALDADVTAVFAAMLHANDG